MKYTGLIYGYLLVMFGQAIIFDKWSNIDYWNGQIIGLIVIFIIWFILNRTIFKDKPEKK